jgi:hypothetical protein
VSDNYCYVSRVSQRKLSLHKGSMLCIIVRSCYVGERPRTMEGTNSDEEKIIENSNLTVHFLFVLFLVVATQSQTDLPKFYLVLGKKLRTPSKMGNELVSLTA